MAKTEQDAMAALSVDDKEPAYTGFSFPNEELKVLELWKELDVFKECMRLSEGRPEYTFYDGPPFATGLPHYGHILAGTIKDIVTRYAYQTGHNVSRRAGWDTHGLPVEYEIDQKLGIKSKADVMKIGIDKYNAECRAIVMRYSSEWVHTVNRMGRWIDFDNDYKTLYPSYMESCWWVFAQLYEKGKVYRGSKIMPYSTTCLTPLSNFEANLNYKDVMDPTVVVAFPLVDEPGTSLLAWTTTPWTLVSNLALCVHPDFEYLKIEDKETKNVYIILESRLSAIYVLKKKKGKKEAELPYTVLGKIKGSDLHNKKYKPLFPYFTDLDTAFRVTVDTYVTDGSGTGIVHQSPAFGEDDYRVCIANGIVVKGGRLPCPVDEAGNFTDEVPDFAGVFCKDADKDIIIRLKGEGRVVKKDSVMHSYPFCWRSDTPLIYRSIPSWFIDVESVKDKLVSNNHKSEWVPKHVQEGRMHSWLDNARDWAVSRNRYWGTPIPIWANEDFSEVKCISSIAELERLTGATVTDLHREHIDHLEIPSEKGGPPLKRIEEVFDCWFESGSMPYAQRHHPFENAETFDKAFPADFIAEGIDQTRGWFYTLLVLSTLLFDKQPFKNVIANGMVLAEDGKKMSKRLKNYPPPDLVFEKFGADAVRLFLINSPVVRGETLNFREEGVRDVIKNIFKPWHNSRNFFLQAVQGVDFSFDFASLNSSTNHMDRWVLSYANDLLTFIHTEMKAYRLYTVVPRLILFIEYLTNWYIKLNRNRLKGKTTPEDRMHALSALFEVLYMLAKIMAPFTPFLSENMYQSLRGFLKTPEQEHADSVHYLMVPQPRGETDTRIITDVKYMQTVIETGRVIRDQKTLPLKLELLEVVVIHNSTEVTTAIEGLAKYVADELKVDQVSVSTDGAKYGLFYKCYPNERALGRRLGKNFKAVKKELATLSSAQIEEYVKNKTIEVAGQVIEDGELEVSYTFAQGAESKYAVHSQDGIVVLLDTTVNDDKKVLKTAKEIKNRVQRLRNKTTLQVTDRVVAYLTITTDSPADIAGVVKDQAAYLSKELQYSDVVDTAATPRPDDILIEEAVEIEGATGVLALARA